MKCNDKETCTQPVKQLLNSIVDLADQQVSVFNSMIKLLRNNTDNLNVGQSALRGIMEQKTSSCCDIPEPCWMPLEIADITCHVCPGETGKVHLRITNMDFRAHQYTLVAAGQDPAHISFDVSSFTLGPKERRTVTARFNTDIDNKKDCPEFLEVLIWALGCRNSYLRWTIKFDKPHTTCCFEFDVEDTPDYILHWYHHFYHPRDCFGKVTIQKTQPTPEG